jgi:large subunit ribosomal protein L21
MYAIVKTGGKQYRVERGQTLLVERLSADEGSNVALEPILYRSEDAVFDAAGLKKVKVTAKVLAHERGEKLRVFKFKPKRGYKRRTGHRQELTRIEVTDIRIGAHPPASAKQAAPKSAAKPVAAKPAPAKAAAEPQAMPVATKPKAAKASARPAAAKKPAATKPDSTPTPAASRGGEAASTPTNPASAAGGGEEQEDRNGS